MFTRIRLTMALMMVLLCLFGVARAEMAEDITGDCLFNGDKGRSLKDDSYRTVWVSSRYHDRFSIVVEAPEGKTIGGLLIRWDSWPLALTLETRNESGQWEMIGSCEGEFLAQYIPLDGLTSVRLMERETMGKVRLEISSMDVFTPGELPADVQQWQKPSDHVDLMLIATHPDDEVLWFGGLLPTYAGEQRKEVLVVNTSYARNDRRLELLDCLWTCGVRTYPVFMQYPDICTGQRDLVLRRWNGEQLWADMTALYRRYKPEVVVLHAADGESGHGAHIVVSEAGRDAAAAAADPACYPESAQEYGTWDIPKVYVHKHDENQIQMDWHQPLQAFDGLTAYQVADLGFQCHKSQLGSEWFMQVGGENDNSLFGLWRSQVGPDVEKTDLFENIQP